MFPIGNDKVIDITPTPEGYARIGHRFAAQIIGDIRLRRQADDRALLVEVMKVAGMLAQSNPTILARLLVAIEQDERLVLP